MKFSKLIQVVDSHTMGEPTRIVTGGIPNIKGKTMAEKKSYLENNLDNIRTGIMHEPRGHKNMFGAIITEPVHDEADFGVIFMDGGGYLNMCGHGSIGTATVAVEIGLVKAVEPYTNLTLDVPAGIVDARVKVQNGKAKEVSIVNVPSFLYKKDVKIDIPNIGEIKVDISFGGSFFAIVNGKDLNLEVIPENIDKLTDFGMKIRDILNKTIKVTHPTLSHIKNIDLVEIYSSTKNEKATFKNVVIFGEGQIDRSPCGTGTSAKLASLYGRGELKVSEDFIYESILGTTFKGKILKTTKVGEYDGIIPEITGKAYITGFNQLLFDDEDIFENGFTLK
ncbi:proline racemase [Clostridium fallax]|nr:proline racemase [Clostridium fallax]